MQLSYWNAQFMQQHAALQRHVMFGSPPPLAAEHCAAPESLQAPAEPAALQIRLSSGPTSSMCSVKFSVSTCVPPASLVMLRTPLRTDGREPAAGREPALPVADNKLDTVIVVVLGVRAASSPSNSNSKASSRSSCRRQQHIQQHVSFLLSFYREAAVTATTDDISVKRALHDLALLTMDQIAACRQTIACCRGPGLGAGGRCKQCHRHKARGYLVLQALVDHK